MKIEFLFLKVIDIHSLILIFHTLWPFTWKQECIWSHTSHTNHRIYVLHIQTKFVTFTSWSSLLSCLWFGFHLCLCCCWDTNKDSFHFYWLLQHKGTVTYTTYHSTSASSWGCAWALTAMKVNCVLWSWQTSFKDSQLGWISIWRQLFLCINTFMELHDTVSFTKRDKPTTNSFPLAVLTSPAHSAKSSGKSLILSRLRLQTFDPDMAAVSALTEAL